MPGMLAFSQMAIDVAATAGAAAISAIIAAAMMVFTSSCGPLWPAMLDANSSAPCSSSSAPRPGGV